MLRAVRTLAPSRLAAAVLALALTGAPGIAGLHAPEAEHRCTCRAEAGVHACACVRCHAAAAAARRASEERAPPCHRAAPSRPVPPPERDGRAPCWTGSCGSPDPAAASPLALEAFLVPAAAALPAPPPAGRVALPAGEGRELPLWPDTPPPRAA